MRQIEERNQVERVVMKHRVHIAFEPSADKIGIHAGDRVARNIRRPNSAAHVPFERLQPAVRQVLFPSPAGMVQPG